MEGAKNVWVYLAIQQEIESLIRKPVLTEQEHRRLIELRDQLSAA